MSVKIKDAQTVFNLSRHIKISLQNVAIRNHNISVSNSHIPIDTRKTLSSVRVKSQGLKSVELSYNTDYADKAWAYNITGITEWTLKDWNTHKHELVHKLTEELLDKKIPKKEIIRR